MWSQVGNGSRVFQSKTFSLSWIVLVSLAARLYIFLVFSLICLSIILLREMYENLLMLADVIL